MKLKTPKELCITPTQFKNLCKLTTFVRTKVEPPHFNIANYYTGHGVDSRPEEATYECGTSACFCGYGPLAGVTPKRSENWEQYQHRVFGSSFNGYTRTSGDLYRMLFSEDHVNNRDAAVRRGAYFLTHGIPQEHGLSCWEAPKTFRAPWKLIAAAANA